MRLFIRILVFSLFFLSFAPCLAVESMDTVPPEPFVPHAEKTILQQGDEISLSFETFDVDSGIDHYEVSLDGQKWERKESPVLVKATDLGWYLLVIRAYDKAGNYRDAKLSLENVKALPTAQMVARIEKEDRNSSLPNMPWYILSSGLLLMIFVILLRYRSLRIRELSNCKRSVKA